MVQLQDGAESKRHREVVRFERGLCPRPELGEASEGASAAPSEETMQMGRYHRAR
jgi:hypothetical protein